MNKRFHSTSLILAFAALIVSCNNDDANDADNLNAVYNDAASQTAYNDVISVGDESVIDDDLSSFKLDDAEKISAPCAIIIRITRITKTAITTSTKSLTKTDLTDSNLIIIVVERKIATMLILW